MTMPIFACIKKRISFFNHGVKIRVIKDKSFAVNLHFSGTLFVPFLNTTFKTIASNRMKSLYKNLGITSLCRMNPFVLALTSSPKENPEEVRIILRALQELLKVFQDGVPFTEIMSRVHSYGYECTVDDLLAWSVLIKQPKTLAWLAKFGYNDISRPLEINNDTGIYMLSEGCPYNNLSYLAEVHFQYPAETSVNIPTTPDTSTYSGDQALDRSAEAGTGFPVSYTSSSSEALNEAFSEVLLPLFGFLFTLLGTFIINVVIENVKTYYGIRTSDDDEHDDTESKFE
jgi:hypothetical protein